MKKRGFTLVETLTSMLLIIIIGLIGVKGYKYYDKRITEIENDISINDVCEILTYGKEYCFYNNTRGKYKVYNKNGVYIVSFTSADGNIVSEKLNQEFKLYDNNFEKELLSKEIQITEKGYVQPESFYFKNNLLDEYRLSIRPGGNLITMKGDDYYN